MKMFGAGKAITNDYGLKTFYPYIFSSRASYSYAFSAIDFRAYFIFDVTNIGTMKLFIQTNNTDWFNLTPYLSGVDNFMVKRISPNLTIEKTNILFSDIFYGTASFNFLIEGGEEGDEIIMRDVSFDPDPSIFLSNKYKYSDNPVSSEYLFVDDTIKLIPKEPVSCGFIKVTTNMQDFFNAFVFSDGRLLRFKNALSKDILEVNGQIDYVQIQGIENACIEDIVIGE